MCGLGLCEGVAVEGGGEEVAQDEVRAAVVAAEGDDVHLFVDKEIVKYFERKPLKSQTITGKDADGSIELVVSITHEMEILPLIFWYIPHIKVLEPQWLADIVKSKVDSYVQSI